MVRLNHVDPPFYGLAVFLNGLIRSKCIRKDEDTFLVTCSDEILREAWPSSVHSKGIDFRSLLQVGYVPQWWHRADPRFDSL